MIGRSLNGVVCAVAALTLFLGATPARAGLITYPNYASWSAAVSGVNTATLPDSPSYIYIGTGSASVTYDGVTFSTSAALSNGQFFNIGTGLLGAPAPELSSQFQTVGVDNILITFAGPVAGFALNYGTFHGHPVTFTLSNGDSFTQGSTANPNYYPLPDFVGVTDSPFTSVQITSPDSFLNIGSPSFAAALATAVPEPTSMTMLGIGAMSLVGYGLRRRRQAKVAV
jgi:PEP-CTERM motif